MSEFKYSIIYLEMQERMMAPIQPIQPQYDLDLYKKCPELRPGIFLLLMIKAIFSELFLILIRKSVIIYLPDISAKT